MSPKIKAVKLYQAVIFDKRSETYFTTLPVSNKISPEIRLVMEIMSIEIKSASETILVPITNVSCIYLMDNSADDYKENVKKIKAEKGTLKSQDIK